MFNYHIITFPKAHTKLLQGKLKKLLVCCLPTQRMGRLVVFVFFLSLVKVGGLVGFFFVFFYLFFFLIAEKNYQGKVFDFHNTCVSFCPWYFKTV